MNIVEYCRKLVLRWFRTNYISVNATLSFDGKITILTNLPTFIHWKKFETFSRDVKWGIRLIVTCTHGKGCWTERD